MLYRAIVLTRKGGPEVLIPAEFPIPDPAGHQVLLRVQYCGVGFTDVLMRHGQYIYAPKMPFVPGYEIVGTVEKTGAEVHGIQKGRRMAALTMTGGYAEYILVNADDLVEVPDELDGPAACGAILNYVTAWQILHRFAHAQTGQTVLISGASGGVGIALLQLGRLIGLKMYGLCSLAKAELVRDNGGIPIESRGEDFSRQLQDAEPAGFDAYFDGLGGSFTWKGYRLLKRSGKLICFGLTSAIQNGKGRKRVVLQTLATLGLAKLFKGRESTFYGIATLYRKTKQPFKDDLLIVWKLMAEGRIQPSIAVVLPLNEVRKAHELLEKSEARGKIVLAC